jgi:mono/diheme cytochrome c family protein
MWFMLTTPGLHPVIISSYEPAILSPNETTHNLGTVNTDSKVEHTWILYNTGGKPLYIKDVQTSCGCTAVDVPKKAIAPGGFAPLKVTLDTSIKLGKVKKTVTVISNDHKHPETKLYLVGNVIQPMQGHPRMNVKDPLVLFKGECATCHVLKGKGKSGKALFRADCGMCHGMNAEGGVATGLLNIDFGNEQRKALVRKVIAEGSPTNPEMPPFSKAHGGPLTDPEIDSLMMYLEMNAQAFKELGEKAFEEPEDE